MSKNDCCSLAGRLLTLALAVTLAASVVTGCTRRPDAYDIDGRDVDVVFLHTSDIHSRLLPYDMDVMLTDEHLGLDPKAAPFGGVARLAAVVKQTRKDFDRVAYIDSGDVFQGAPIFNSFGGEPEFRAMTQLKVDAFAIGNHEFDNGTQHLVTQALKFANFPMLAANYIISDADFEKNIGTNKVASPYTIFNVKGVRVGVIGLGYVGGSAKHGGASRGVVVLQNRETLQAYVDFLRPMVDLVAVTSHASYHDDLEYIPRTEGIDIVFGGHLHIALDPPKVVQDCDISKLKRERDRYQCDTPEKLEDDLRRCKEKTCLAKPAAERPKCEAECVEQSKLACKRESETRRYTQRLHELNKEIAFLEKRGCHPRNVLLVHSGAFLKYVGRLQVTLRQCNRLAKQKVCLEWNARETCVKWQPRRCVGNKSTSNDWEVIAHNYRLIPVDNRLPQDPQMLQLLDPFTLELYTQQQLMRVLGYTPRRLFRFSKGTGDSELGNLVTSSMMARDQVWADFAISNSLGIRSDIVAGPVTDEQMTNIFPFENSVTVMYLTGYEIQEMFDFIAQRSASRGCQSQAQVSGATATLNCGGCPGKGGNPCAGQAYDGEACAQKVTIGGSGRACKEDKDCVTDTHGKPTGEVCSTQKHPNPAEAAKGKPFRCWLPISCTRSYRLATNDYIAHGGSGFTVLARNTTQKNLKIPLREASKDYIVQMPSCSQIPQTYEEKLSKAALQYILEPADRDALKGMEAAALKMDLSGVNKAYKALIYDAACSGGSNCSKLQKRVTALDDKIKAAAAGSYARQKLLNERKGINSYLGCVSEKPDSDNKCLGLTCWHVKQCRTCTENSFQCKQYSVKEVGRCETLARVRAALRCITLPCVDMVEDGRINRIFRDAAGPPHTDPDYPG